MRRQTIILPGFRPHYLPLLLPQLSELLILLPALLPGRHQLPFQSNPLPGLHSQRLLQPLRLERLLLLLLLLLLAQEGQEAVGGGELPPVASRGDAFTSRQSEAAADFAHALCYVRFGATARLKISILFFELIENLWEMSLSDCGEPSFCFPESLSPRR